MSTYTTEQEQFWAGSFVALDVRLSSLDGEQRAIRAGGSHGTRTVDRAPRPPPTYRIVFLLETIGSIVYQSRHLAQMKRHTTAGYVITCVGDDHIYASRPSRQGQSLADCAARHVEGFLVATCRRR